MTKWRRTAEVVEVRLEYLHVVRRGEDDDFLARKHPRLSYPEVESPRLELPEHKAQSAKVLSSDLSQTHAKWVRKSSIKNCQKQISKLLLDRTTKTCAENYLSYEGYE